MAEELNKNTGAVENTEPETVTMTKEELDALLQKTGDQRVSQALKKQEQKNAEKVREAQKVAAMSAEEKFRYELDQREAAIAAKELELTLAENRNVCSKILADKGLSLDLVDFVVAESADDMDARIKALDKAFKASVKAEVEKRLGANNVPKKTTDSYEAVTKNDFKKMSYAQRTELKLTNPELYNSLNS